MGNNGNYGNGNWHKPLHSYSGRVRNVTGEKIVARLPDPSGLERDVVMVIDEIESRRPIKVGDLICVDVLRANGNLDPKIVKLGNFVEEKKYIVD